MLHLVQATERQEVTLAEPRSVSPVSLYEKPLPGGVDHIGRFFLGTYRGERLIEEPLAYSARTAILMEIDRAMSFKEVERKAEEAGLVLLPRLALLALSEANSDIEATGPVFALGDSVRVRVEATEVTRPRQMVFLLTRHGNIRSIISHDVRHDFPPGSRFLATKTRS